MYLRMWNKDIPVPAIVFSQTSNMWDNPSNKLTTKDQSERTMICFIVKTNLSSTYHNYYYYFN